MSGAFLRRRDRTARSLRVEHYSAAVNSRMQAALRHRGWVVNHKKVKRLMREHGLHPLRRRRFVATTDSDHDEPVFPDRSGDCDVDGPNQLWVADLTYIAILGGFVYLAAIMDAWSRRIVGYALGRRIDARLTLAALTAAIEGRNPPHPDASTTPTGARNTPPRPIGPCYTTMAWSARWDGAATPTTTP